MRASDQGQRNDFATLLLARRGMRITGLARGWRGASSHGLAIVQAPG
ncbi:hypothetical protein [Bordetella bronchiseptica]|nr:hypothetical protein [Bordetella bronchiseptica]